MTTSDEHRSEKDGGRGLYADQSSTDTGSASAGSAGYSCGLMMDLLGHRQQ